MKQFFIFCAFSAVAAEPLRFRATQLRTLVHEGKPFTQGLELVDDDTLIETSGAYPPGTKSFIRLIDLHDGRPKRSDDAALTGTFAEGVARVDDGWLVTTYDSHKALKLSPELQLLAEQDYPWQGWGIAHGDGGFFATDGTEYMMRLKPDLSLEEKKAVTCMGEKVAGMNELEFVKDFEGLGPILFGNLYRTRYVLGLDPSTFECKCFFDLENFGEQSPKESFGFHVANGIAYVPKSNTFIVTGKNWDEMFEISLSRESGGAESLRRWLLSHPAQSLLQLPEERSWSLRRMSRGLQP